MHRRRLALAAWALLSCLVGTGVVQAPLGAQQPESQSWQVLVRQALGLTRKGQYQAARALYQRALQLMGAAEELLQLRSLVMVLSQVNEALAQGRSAAARQLWEQGVQQLKTAVKRLQQLEKVQPKLQEAGRLYEQVNQLLQQGRYGEALPLMQRSVAIVEQALGPAHPEVADSLHHLASLYQLQGNYWAAEPLFRRSLAILEQALGPAHPEVATSLNNLALLYWAQGNLPQSLPLLQRAADIEEAHLARNLVVGDETYKRQFLATQELAESSDGLGMPLSDLA